MLKFIDILSIRTYMNTNFPFKGKILELNNKFKELQKLSF